VTGFISLFAQSMLAPAGNSQIPQREVQRVRPELGHRSSVLSQALE
jgi:hypothetical protein